MVTSDREDATIKVIRASDFHAQTGQSAGALRLAGVDRSHGASRIWMGQVSNAPGVRSAPHHHGEAETAGYVLRGHARIYYGENYQQVVDLYAGDFVFVPPHTPHIEANASDTEELVYITARTPDNIV